MTQNEFEIVSCLALQSEFNRKMMKQLNRFNRWGKLVGFALILVGAMGCSYAKQLRELTARIKELEGQKED